MEDIAEIMKIASEVEEEYMGKVSINPYIALEGEERITPSPP